MDSKRKTPREDIWAAIERDDRRCVRGMLERTPELATASAETAKLYETLIFHWLYVHDTPLHLAAAGYRVEIASMLVAAGADPNAARNHRRGAPLHYAADGFIQSPGWDEKRQVAMMELLVDAGANINAPDKNGATPLHRAVRTRCAAAVECLFRLGCNHRLKNQSGSTAFHLAVQQTGRGGSGTPEAKAAQRRIVGVFREHGVSTSLQDGKGRTVVEAAKNAAVRQWLVQAD